ncbi:ATP-grasp domain-containing protein [Pseudomonas sp. 25 R 14]|uniref:ATP-grasp domain-containing protein n=1 Tax=Pseudomonas sp. 25 R 14 TaxID=1844109 RepID=UPI0008125163|nr:ATP-grasp domain-containing protein [Pseudomonas sp. 25 R 14]CRM80570.1 argininosuccinate lyase [Pseudomonas sp. 25 R 14]
MNNSLSDSNTFEINSWLVVDGYSSGALYAGLLRKKGYNVYHLSSTERSEKTDRLTSTFVAEDYDCTFYYNGDIGHTLNQISSIKGLSHIVAGCETGVALADTISSALGLAGNGCELSTARRNKLLMAQVLLAKGVRAAKSFEVSCVDELVSVEKNLGYPLVVKPLSSAASDDVYICHSADEARMALNRILGKNNALGIFNSTALVQQLLRGIQYVVNTASSGGQHHIVEIWKDYRFDKGSAYIYDREELQPRLAHDSKIVDYCEEVLDALNITHGPAHIELMVDQGIPTLIELGTRPAGGIQHDVMTDAQGFSHVDATISVLAGDGEWITSNHQSPTKAVYAVALVSDVDGYLKGYKNFDVIKGLASFKSLTGLPDVGAKLRITRDIASQPGLLMLSNDDPDQIRADYENFRILEMRGLFVISNMEK